MYFHAQSNINFHLFSRLQTRIGTAMVTGNDFLSFQLVSNYGDIAPCADYIHTVPLNPQVTRRYVSVQKTIYGELQVYYVGILFY